MIRLLSFFILIVACTTTQKTNIINMPINQFDFQGHRGCRGLMPENTIPAMLQAIDLGVTTLETDAIITKDKKVILSHEHFFNHEISTKPDGTYITRAEEKLYNIYQMNYDEVKMYDVGLKQHPRFPDQTKVAVAKPLLSDMIDAAEKYCKAKHKQPIHYNIEIKSDPTTDGQYHPFPAEFVELLVAVIQTKKITERTIIQSFDSRTLQYIHQKYPSIKTALLIEDFDKKSFKDQLIQLGYTPTIYSPHFSLVTPNLIEDCKKNQIRIIPWTVNDIATMQKLKKMGVDGIISDFPNLFSKL